MINVNRGFILRRKGHITVTILLFSLVCMTTLNCFSRIERRQYEVIIEQNKRLKREIKHYLLLIERENKQKTSLAKSFKND